MAYINLLNNLKIVLVETQGAMNIGSVCRAMKNFGLNDLTLVRPACALGLEAEKMALSAKDLLEKAKITDSLPDALMGSTLVLGTSNRRGDYHEPNYTLKEAIEVIRKPILDGPVTILFGREDWGLSKEELKFCQGTIRIQTHPSFSSMNLSQAVLLIAYELFNAFGSPKPLDNPHEGDPYQNSASFEEINRLFTHISTVLERCEFLPKSNPDALFQVLRSFFARSQPKKRETNILMGIFSNIDGFMKKYVRKPKDDSPEECGIHWKKVTHPHRYKVPPKISDN
ncbi:MAG: RNA methyltransferase [Candidatus Riflebacteria bacterium]|nr:RNA methyltransferase [Candidatus Riflebacteria bacterium]